MIEPVRNTEVIQMEDITVVYNLIFKNALYSVESYVEAGERKKNYCYIENITDDEGEAEAFLKQMIKGKVFPVHIKDMAEDYFGK
jgi:hypothetical protein